MKKKILIITYYWPPSGGAGVQRWLKLTKYLSKTGVEVHVLTVNPKKASYLQLDESLVKEIHTNVKIHYTDSFEPINYYGKLFGKSKIPTAGFANVQHQNWTHKAVHRLRSHFFIPDPRIGWKKFALKKALSIINKEQIKTVITTSPPHSVQMIGWELKRKLKDEINWIVDFRDPWTDIYYYSLLNNSKYSHLKNIQKERAVIEDSDKIITVSSGFKKIFLSKTDKINADKIKVISNAYDSEDFKNSEEIQSKKDEFIIAYIGTISEKYKPEVFFIALEKLIKLFPTAPIIFKATGIVSEQLKKNINSYIGDKAVFEPPVTHDVAIKRMLEAQVLLLVTPEYDGVVPGKIFEYLASQRRIVSIGKGDIAEIIDDCKAGSSFLRDEKDEIFLYLKDAFSDFQNGVSFKPDVSKIKKLSWEYKAKKMLEEQYFIK